MVVKDVLVTVHSTRVCGTLQFMHASNIVVVWYRDETVWRCGWWYRDMSVCKSRRTMPYHIKTKLPGQVASYLDKLQVAWACCPVKLPGQVAWASCKLPGHVVWAIWLDKLQVALASCLGKLPG